MSSLDIDGAFAEFASTGSPQRLGEVYDALAPELLRVAIHMTRSASDAEDILQATFVTAIERAASFEKGRPVRPWLTGILAHHARASRRNALRAPDPERTRTRDERSPVDDAEERELFEALDRVLLDLPEAFRPVLVLRLKHGLTAPEIAEALARPPGTVRSQLARGLESVRRAMPAGLAGAFVLLAAQPVRGLDSIRAVVLAQAAHPAPVAATLATLTGVLALKKILALVVVAVVVWIGWRQISSNGDGIGMPASVAEPKTELAATPKAESAQGKPDLTTIGHEDERAPVPEFLGSVGAARVDIEVVRARDHRAAPGEVVLVTFEGPSLPYADERALKTDENGRATLENVPPGWIVASTVQGGETRGLAAQGRTLALVVDQPDGIRVEGEVVDSHGNGVRDASIWCSDRANSLHGRVVATADAAGRFHLEDLGPQRFVAAKARSFALSPLHPVHGSPGELSHVRIVLERQGASVRGRVVDARGQVVANAKVLVGEEQIRFDAQMADGLSAASSVPQRTSTDAEGRFEVDGVLMGRVPVQARAIGSGTARVEIDVGPSGADQDIVLPNEAVVSGIVHDDRGGGLSSVEARCGEYWQFATSRAFTDTTGRFDLHGLNAGSAVLVATTLDGQSAQTTLDLAAGARARWDPQFQSSGTGTHAILRCRLIDERRAPLVAWSLFARRESMPGENPIQTVPTDENGRCHLQVERDAAYQLRIHGPHEASQFPRATLSDVRATDGEIEIVVSDASRTTASILGTVVDPSGAPASDAQVIVLPAPSDAWIAVPVKVSVEHETGRFVIVRVPSGKVSIEVRSLTSPLLRVGERNIEAGADVDLGTLRLKAAGHIVCTLQGAGDENIAGIDVSITDLRFLSAGQFEQHGRERKSNALAPGHYTVVARGRGIADVRDEVDVTAGRDAQVVLTLHESDMRNVRVETETGSQREDWVTVEVMGRDAHSICMRNAAIDPDGMAHLQVEVLPGQWKLVAQGSSGRRGELEFAHASGDQGPELLVRLPGAR